MTTKREIKPSLKITTETEQFWYLHTNFKLNHTTTLNQSVLQVEGVESIGECGKYYIVVGIGRIFNPTDVLDKIKLEIIKHV